MLLDARRTKSRSISALGTGHYLSPGGRGGGGVVGVFRGRSHGFLKTFRGNQP